MLYALLLQLIGAWSKTNSEASSLTSIPMKGTSPGNPVWPQALSGEKPMGFKMEVEKTLDIPNSHDIEKHPIPMF